MMKKSYLYAIAAVLAVAGCAKDPFVEEPAQEGRIVIDASVEGEAPATKVRFDSEGNFHWTEGDKIAVEMTNTDGETVTTSYNKTFTVDKALKGVFSGYIENLGQALAENATAVYPADCATYDGSTLTYTLPSTYDYVDADSLNTNYTAANTNGNYMSFNAPMIATISKGKATFQHMGGVICVKFDNNLPNSNGIDYTVTVTSDKSLSGTFTISEADGYKVINATDANSNGTVTVTYKGNGGVGTNSSRSGVFYIPAPIGTHKVSVKVTGNDDTTPFNTEATETVIKRGSLKMFTLDAKDQDLKPDEVRENLASSNEVTVGSVTSDNNTIEIPEAGNSSRTKVSITIKSIESDLTVEDVAESLAGESIDSLVLYLPSTTNTITINEGESTVLLESATGKEVTINQVNSSTADYTIVIGEKVKVCTLNVVKGNVYIAEGAAVETATKDSNNTASEIVITAESDTTSVQCDTNVFTTIKEPEYEFRKVLAEGGEITLTQDYTGDFVVSATKPVTVHLGGCTVTNKEGDTFTVNLGSSLTIDGEGTVDNTTHGKADICNNGTVVLSGGKYTRSKEAENSKDSSGGNSYYNILNHGQMTINEGVTVYSSGHFSSLIDNGYYSYTSTNPRSGYVSGTNQAAPSLTINGGDFSGGLNTVKNDDNATLTIHDGTFTNTTQGVIQNNHEATINGGTFTAATNDSGDYYMAVHSRHFDGSYDSGATTINGGTFTGHIRSGEFKDPNGGSTGGKITINGGTFTGDLDVVSGNPVEVNGGDFVGELNQITYSTKTSTISKSKPTSKMITINKGTFTSARAVTLTAGTADITLKADASIDRILNQKGATINLDLGGYTLSTTYSGKNDNIVSNGTILKISNGTINSTKSFANWSSLVKDNSCTLSFDNVTLTTADSTAISVQGPDAKLIIKNSTITSTTGYAVSTNATENTGATITLYNSTFKGAQTGFMNNVPATVSITNCAFSGDHQGALLRGGTYTISGSSFTLDDGLDASANDYAGDESTWRSGNKTAFAGLVIGNRGGSAYAYPTTVTLKGTNAITSNNAAFPALWVNANSAEGNGVTLTYPESTTTLTTAYSDKYIWGSTNITVNGTAVSTPVGTAPTK